MKIDMLARCSSIALILFICQLVSSAQWKPILEDKSSDMKKFTDVQVKMSCTFNSSPQANVSWFKDGTKIADSSRIRSSLILQTKNKTWNMYQLSIQNLMESDGGTYVCSAKNSEGTTEGRIKLSIFSNYAPKIKKIHDVVLYKGQTFHTRCEASALPYATYSWQKKSGFIDKRVVVDMGDGQLSFSGVRKADEGEYICTATNKVGDSMESFKVRVVKNPSWLQRPKNLTQVDSGASVTISGLFVGSSDGLIVTWYKDDQVYPGSKEVLMRKDGATFTKTSVTFQKAELDNNGDYSVIVQNGVGSIDTKSKLVVYSKPQVIIKEGGNVSVRLGDTLILQCTVNSLPLSIVNWKFNGIVMAASDQFRVPASSGKMKVELAYAIRDAKYSDGGHYYCIGKNNKGESKAAVTVKVKDIATVDSTTEEGAKSSSKLIIIISCIAVLFVICIIVITVFLIRCRKRETAVPPVTFSPYSGSKDSDIHIGTQPERQHSGSFSVSESGAGNHDHARNDSDKNMYRRPLLAKYRRGTGSKSPSEENILPGHGVPLEPEQVTVGSELGSGKFGCIIHKGEVVIEGETKAVVIKTLQVGAEERHKVLFAKELETMKKLSHHPNVIGLIGWCGTEDNLQIVTELGVYGSLLNFLRTFKKNLYMNTLESESQQICDFDLKEKDLISFGWQVSSGMRYLSSMGIVHKDLATRNILLGHQHVCKIINFGLDKEGIYASSTGGEIPLNWMGFESIFKGEFTSKSDVWSFGILLWEITTLGEYPYPGFSTPDELINALKEGYRMDRPLHCSDVLYDIMMSCWQQSPYHRPDFGELCTKLGSLLCDYDTHIDFEVLKQSFKDKEGWDEGQ